MKRRRERGAFQAFARCGCQVGHRADKSIHREAVAKQVTAWLREGLRVEYDPSTPVDAEVEVGCTCQRTLIDTPTHRRTKAHDPG